MYQKVCPVCKNKFFSENKSLALDTSLHNYCTPNKKWNKGKNARPRRTSTPVNELENTPCSSFSDSVTDFFYQSWKSGLMSNASSTTRVSIYHQNDVYATSQPVYYPSPVVYVNTVIYQSYIPPSYMRVGYRTDGTFGVLPPFHLFYNN